jgi:hypothetical protein
MDRGPLQGRSKLVRFVHTTDPLGAPTALSGRFGYRVLYTMAPCPLNICRDGWICELHPDQPEGHDDWQRRRLALPNLPSGRPRSHRCPGNSRSRKAESWDRVDYEYFFEESTSGDALAPHPPVRGTLMRYTDIAGKRELGEMWTFSSKNRSLRCLLTTHPVLRHNQSRLRGGLLRSS